VHIELSSLRSLTSPRNLGGVKLCGRGKKWNHPVFASNSPSSKLFVKILSKIYPVKVFLFAAKMGSG